MKVSVLIPAYNEERIIGRVVRDINRVFLKNLKNILASYNLTDFEIFIVDDGSTDSTSEIAKKLAKTKKINYIRFKSSSRRENLAKSFKRAEGDIIAYMDIDMDISFLPNLINKIGEYDIAIASRYKKGAKIKRHRWRLIISLIYNKFIRFLFHSKIKDHQCGFKVFKKPVLLDLVKQAGYNKSRGWFWDAEIMIRAQRLGYKIAEVPINWEHGEKSSFSFKREIRMIPYILKLRMML